MDLDDFALDGVRRQAIWPSSLCILLSSYRADSRRRSLARSDERGDQWLDRIEELNVSARDRLLDRLDHLQLRPPRSRSSVVCHSYVRSSLIPACPLHPMDRVFPFYAQIEGIC